ncbi:TRAP transporter large permease subunit [Pseudorhodoplanes sp.]|uniref:TRAP transporter large permease n=1 Tax=Pseudorhodoplanes sp. TaxID=1934341 RepID=UPI003D12F15C
MESGVESPPLLFRRTIQAASDYVDAAIQALCIAATASFALVMLLGVVFRYTLNMPLYWSDEVALILFIWAAFLSIATGYRHDQHIRIDMLIERLTPVWRSRVAVVAEGLAGGYLLCLLVSAVSSWEFFYRSRTDALQISMTWAFAAVLLAAAVMLIHWAQRICDWHPATISMVAAIGMLFFLISYFHAASFVDGTAIQAIVLTIVFFGSLLMGLPVAFVIGLFATSYLGMSHSVSFETIASQMFYGTNTVVLMAIPLLILAGGIMHAGGVAARLVAFAQVLVGRIRGGLGSSNVLASYIFGDISGSSVSDTAAIGALMIPEMKKRGYQPAFCAALQGAAGTLGMMAPLSITILLYASAINISIGRLAVATIVPATLVMLSFMLYAIWHGRRFNYPKEATPLREVGPRILAALPGLGALVLIIGGILGGVFTPAEVGVILLVYVLLLTIVFQRSIKWRDVAGLTLEAAFISGMTLLLVGSSNFLGFILALNEGGAHLINLFSGVADSRYAILAGVTIVFIVLGMFLEAPAIIFGFLPSFLPLLHHAKIDPIHWGVLFVINMGLGMIVPPIAVNLFVSTKLAGVTYEAAVRAAFPFMVVMTIDLAIVAIFPSIALTLPRLIFGYPF